MRRCCAVGRRAFSSRTVQHTDVEALDAYSRTVIGVVDSVGPAVGQLKVKTPRGDGTGSGFIISSDGYIYVYACMQGWWNNIDYN